VAETQALNFSRQSATSGGWERQFGEWNILWGKWQCCSENMEDSRGKKTCFHRFQAGTKVRGYTWVSTKLGRPKMGSSQILIAYFILPLH